MLMDHELPQAGLGSLLRSLSNTYCVLAVTMADLYSGHDDLFTAGLAMMQQPRCAVFSFSRQVAHTQ
jgi:hypothetical protein